MTSVNNIAEASPFLSLDDLITQHAALLQEEIKSQGSPQPEFLKSVQDFIHRGRQTGTRLDNTDERRTAQSLLNYWVTVLYRFEVVEVPDAILAYYQPPTDASFKDSDCPYLGLSPFTEQERDSFFGRDELTASIIQRLKEKRFVILVGPSGSGKTSVLNAGVLPRMKEERKPESKDWIYFPQMTPGSDPLKSLASVFTDNFEQAASKLFEKPAYLIELLNDPNYGGKVGVILVDQFEELFTFCKDDQRRDAFINALLSLNRSATPHRVVLSMRSDYVNQVVRRKELNELFREGEIRVYPLREGELREIIEKPAQKIRLKFQSGIVEQLLREIFGDPVGLPLLQFALLELWKERDCDTITWAAMNRLGTCRDALVQKAVSFYASSTPDEKLVIRRILLRMVRLSDTWEAATEPVRLEDLYHSEENRDEVNHVLEKMLSANLARISNISFHPGVSAQAATRNHSEQLSPDDQFELAHQSLARYWPEITKWFNELRESLVTKRRMELFAANWSILGQSEKGLLDKFQLHEAQNWLASDGAKELGYDSDLVRLVALSKEKLDRERLIQKLWMFGTAALVVIGLVAIVLVFLIGEHRRLKEATSLRLALQADSIKSRQLGLALLLNREAFRKDPNSLEARNSLMRSVIYSPKLSAYLTAGSNGINQLHFTPDGNQIVAVDNTTGRVLAWDAQSHVKKTDSQVFPGTKDRTDSITALSPDGKALAFVNKEGELVVWTSANTQPIVAQSPNKRLPKPPVLCAFTNDNSKLFWLTNVVDEAKPEKQNEFELTSWDFRADKKISRTTERLMAIEFSPDNQTFAAVTSQGDILLSKIDDLKSIGRPLKKASYIQAPELVFSKDGRILASRNAPQSVSVWSLKNQQKLNDFDHSNEDEEVRQSNDSSVNRKNVCFALDPSGQQLVAGYEDGSIGFWDVNQGRGTEYQGPKAKIKQIVLSSDGRKVVTVSEDGSPTVWENFGPNRNTFGQERHELPTGLNRTILRLALDPKDKLLAGLADDGTIILWDFERKLPGGPLSIASSGEVRAVSNDGLLFSFDSGDKISVFDLPNKKVVKQFSLRPSWFSSPTTEALINDIFFSRSGDLMAALYSDNSIGLWNPKTGEFKRELSASANGLSHNYGPRVVDIAIDEAGKKTAVASDDSKIRIWSMNGSKTIEITAGKVTVSDLTFSSDGLKLASIDLEGNLKIWDVEKGTVIRDGIKVEPDVYHVEFIKKDTRLLSLTNSALSSWSLTDPGEDKVLAKTTNILDFSVNPVTDVLALSSTDGSIAIWNVTNGEEQFRFPRDEVAALGDGSNSTRTFYAADGKSLIVGYGSGEVSQILLDMRIWTKRACEIANRPLTQDELILHQVFADEALMFWKNSYSASELPCEEIPETKK